MQYPKRLIEVDLPIKRISAHARNEKDSRCGHIPRLHIYPAARPLAACRAVICAALWPDPADSLCPESFRAAARHLMEQWASNHLKLCGAESGSHFIAIQKDPELLRDNMVLRRALLDFIADYADWDNSIRIEFLEVSRCLTQAAHEALKAGSGPIPFVFDPFAGGAAIPFEALRIGAEAFASDLNPLAVLLNKVLLEHIPQHGKKIIDSVQEWLAWMKPKAYELLSEFFPDDPDGKIPIAYLWARTIISEAPSTGGHAIEVPLLRSMWLTRGREKNVNWALRWARDRNGKVKTEEVTISDPHGSPLKILRPVMEVFCPSSPSEVPSGTVRGGTATCPITGFTTPVKRVRAQLTEKRGGTRGARLYCVVSMSSKNSGRTFRVPTLRDIKAVEKAERALTVRFKPQDLPAEPLPPDGTNGFRVQKYGLRTWGDLFTPRQALVLATYSTLIKEYIARLSKEDESFKVALESVLALVLNRLADLNASLCVWQLNTPNTAHVFGRWALPMVFDFGEVNPLAAAGGSPDSALRRLVACVWDLIAARTNKGTVVQCSATRLPLADDMAAALITDPPYYDAIPYSDILDFFVVWMTRICKHQDFLLTDGLSPKTEECVVDKVKKKDHGFFRRTMTQCMTEGRRVLSPRGIGVVIFAHKTTAGWEAQLESLLNAGFSVTASWPIDTEMESRLRAKGSAALASSVHLVCRPRENPDGSVRADEIGDWRDVLQELPRRIHDWMPRLAEEGVVGADAIFACLGPALEIFSRYARVEKASGEVVTLKEYLEQVWAAVAKEALTMVFQGADASGFEEDARLTAMWLWTLRTGESNGNGAMSDEESEEDEQEEEGGKKGKMAGFVLEYDAARKIAQGLGAHLEDLTSLVEIKGDTARLLPVVERTRALFGKDDAQAPTTAKRKKEAQLKLGFEAELQEAEESGGWGQKGVPRVGSTVLDRVHQAMILFAAGRGEALRRFLVDEGVGRDERFWRLAQALAALYPSGTDERRWVEGVQARKKGLGL
jgi:adenine-specific DNA methylase